MTIFTEPRRYRKTLSDIEAPLSDVLGAAAEQSWFETPIYSIGRSIELDNARHGEPFSLGGIGTGEEIPRRPTSDMVAADDARARVKEQGLDLKIPDGGIRRQALDILIERKRAERRRDDILARGPRGLLPTTASFLTALAVQAADPLNVAASFVPAVGPTRYARMLARARTAAGRAAVRARVGAIEGTVGAAALEPFVLAAARQEQADYDTTDSLLNIAFGTVLGGGLHTLGGAISDAAARRARPRVTAEGELPRLLEQVAPDVREAALRSSVAQSVTGRNVNVEPVLRSGERDPFDPRLSLAEPPAPRPFELGELTRGRYADYTDMSPGDMRALDMVVRELEGTEPGFRVFTEREGQGGTPDVQGIKATTPDWFQERNRQANLSNAERRRAQRQNRKAGREAVPEPDYQHVLTRAQVATVADKLRNRQPLGQREGRIAEELFEIARGLREREARDMLAARAERRAAESREIDAITAREREIVDQGRQSFNRENARLADYGVARAADEDLAAAPKTDDDFATEALDDTLEDLQQMAANLGDEDLISRELNDFDELITTADDYGKAVKAAGECWLRRA